MLARLDTGSGKLSWTNAGHPLPLLVRDGRVVEAALFALATSIYGGSDQVGQPAARLPDLARLRLTMYPTVRIVT